MGIEQHRWGGREAEVSGSEQVNTTSSGSGWIDDIQSHPQGELRGQTKLVKITEDVRKYAAENALDEPSRSNMECGRKLRSSSTAEQKFIPNHDEWSEMGSRDIDGRAETPIERERTSQWSRLG